MNIPFNVIIMYLLNEETKKLKMSYFIISFRVLELIGPQYETGSATTMRFLEEVVNTDVAMTHPSRN